LVIGQSGSLSVSESESKKNESDTDTDSDPERNSLTVKKYTFCIPLTVKFVDMGDI